MASQDIAIFSGVCIGVPGGALLMDKLTDWPFLLAFLIGGFTGALSIMVVVFFGIELIQKMRSANRGVDQDDIAEPPED